MPVTVEQLGPTHLGALRTLLTRDVTHNLYLLGLMEEFGVVCDATRTPFSFIGRFDGVELTAAVFIGGKGGLIVPSACTPAQLGDLLKTLPPDVKVGAAVGEKNLIDTVVQYLGGAGKRSKLQKLYSVSADDLGPFTNPALRQATEADLPQLVPLASACIKELLERDPLGEDPDGFPVRVRQRVKSGRTYVLEHQGRLVFKLDVGSRSQYGAELEGIYTIPSERNKGHATLCMGQISRFLLSSLPRLTVRVDDSSPLGDVVRKVGYLPGRAQRLVWSV